MLNDRRMQRIHLCSLVFLVACGANPPHHPETATRAPAPPPSSVVTDKTPQPVSPGLAVGANILAACKIDAKDLDRAPKFEFDSSQLTSEDAQILDQIAKCMTDGPLKDKHLKLIGRADPRGTTEYNFVLGANRAHQVLAYLEQHGVPQNRMGETSRGELDAQGNDEEGWRLDRRVDITL